MKTPDPSVPPEGKKDANVRSHLQRIARLIDEELPEHWGFFLCAFPFNEHEGRCNYVANAQRQDVRVMLHNLLDRWDKHPEEIGQHRPEKV